VSQAKVITEGEQDRLVLQALLEIRPDDASVNFLAAGGWSSVDSLARSLLVHNNQIVAVVVDADSSDPNLIEERRRFLCRSLGVMAPPSKWHVLVVAPEIESLIFKDRSVVEKLVGHAISDTEFVRGQFEPKNTLVRLLDPASLLTRYKEKLPRMNLETIKNLPEIEGLRAFLSSVGEKRHVVQVR
jgi:hypothetical protein